MKDLVIPILIVSMLISMLVPLPSLLLDIFLVSNLILALVLLMSALIITEPLKLSSLPSMLLLATMYRLSLNVSTTRMILSSGAAGEIINAFGSVVVKGNLVVGLIIFLVITLIQFIVIAKGSERVAEVSARFTLDALPGKQMSIDADVRAGLIDFNEARKKRQDLQTESRFYGALDGAMKFIKGDAIAGLIITFINIIAGFAVGIFIDGNDIHFAFRQYTLLSIGDGLVAQIPALLNSLAAGMIITRVINEENSSLSEELIFQLSQSHKVLLLASILSLCIAFIPNMPFLPFLTLAIVLCSKVIFDLKNSQKNKAKETKLLSKFQPKTPPLLQISVNKKVLTSLVNVDFDSQIKTFQQAVFEKYGLILIQPEFKLQNEDGYTIFMRGNVAIVENSNLEEVELSARLLQDLLTLVAERKDEIADDIMTRRLLDNLETYSPELVSNVVPNIVTTTQITTTLRSLLQEGIPIKNFDVILQAMAEYGTKAGGERLLLEEVRIALRRVISQTFSEKGEINAYILDPIFDIKCVKCERGNTTLSCDEINFLANQLQNISDNTILLTSRGARHLVKDYLELRGINIPVLAHEEIVSSTTIKPLGFVASDYNSEDEEKLVA